MGIDCRHFPGTGEDGSAAARRADGPRRHPVGVAYRLAMARPARRVRPLADGLADVRRVECGWNVRRDPASLASVISGSRGNRRPVVVHRRDNRACGAVRWWRWKKSDPQEPSDHALGRSRGGFTTKIHILCDGHGLPLHFHLTAGQTHESAALDELLVGADACLVDENGERIAWPFAIGGDKGYRADWIDQYLLDLGIEPVIP